MMLGGVVSRGMLGNRDSGSMLGGYLYFSLI